MAKIAASVIFIAISTNSALAGAPTRSQQPVVRPGPETVSRPSYAILVQSAAGVQVSLRPVGRPSGLRGAVILNNQVILAGSKPIAQSRSGSVCNLRAIQGQRLKSIKATIKGCGLSKPVRVTSVAGVGLSQPAIMDCRTAKALNKWVKNGVKPVVGRLGGGVSSLQVIAHYACRTRNSQPGAKISEHGKGHAIDISAINLKNGQSLDVLNGWSDRTQGKLLKKMHRNACGPFGTVLGPSSDRHHRNHFHLDTARYRNGSYCR